jgi:CTD kinase subunit alpha
LLFDPVRRLTAAEALKTTYFTTEEPGMEMPTQLANCGEHHEMSAKLERHRRRQEGK